MTERLKTLKDLKTFKILFGECVLIGELCQEVIKWMKEYKRVQKQLHPNNKDRLIEGKIAGLMHFFNITENDLKEVDKFGE